MLQYPRALPSGDEVVWWLGWPTPSDARDQAGVHVESAALMVRGYVRGRGFAKDTDGSWLVEEDIAAVITSCAARSLNNPAQSVRVEAGGFNEVPGLFAGWTLAELAVLHNYRRRAA